MDPDPIEDRIINLGWNLMEDDDDDDDEINHDDHDATMDDDDDVVVDGMTAPPGVGAAAVEDKQEGRSTTTDHHQQEKSVPSSELRTTTTALVQGRDLSLLQQLQQQQQEEQSSSSSPRAVAVMSSSSSSSEIEAAVAASREAADAEATSTSPTNTGRLSRPKRARRLPNRFGALVGTDIGDSTENTVDDDDDDEDVTRTMMPTAPPRSDGMVGAEMIPGEVPLGEGAIAGGNASSATSNSTTPTNNGNDENDEVTNLTLRTTVDTPIATANDTKSAVPDDICSLNGGTRTTSRVPHNEQDKVEEMEEKEKEEGEEEEGTEETEGQEEIALVKDRKLVTPRDFRDILRSMSDASDEIIYKSDAHVATNIIAHAQRLLQAVQQRKDNGGNTAMEGILQYAGVACVLDVMVDNLHEAKTIQALARLLGMMVCVRCVGCERSSHLAEQVVQAFVDYDPGDALGVSDVAVWDSHPFTEGGMAVLLCAIQIHHCQRQGEDLHFLQGPGEELWLAMDKLTASMIPPGGEGGDTIDAVEAALATYTMAQIVMTGLASLNTLTTASSDEFTTVSSILATFSNLLNILSHTDATGATDMDDVFGTATRAIPQLLQFVNNVVLEWGQARKVEPMIHLLAFLEAGLGNSDFQAIIVKQQQKKNQSTSTSWAEEIFHTTCKMMELDLKARLAKKNSAESNDLNRKGCAILTLLFLFRNAGIKADNNGGGACKRKRNEGGSSGGKSMLDKKLLLRATGILGSLMQEDNLIDDDIKDQARILMKAAI